MSSVRAFQPVPSAQWIEAEERADLASLAKSGKGSSAHGARLDEVFAQLPEAIVLLDVNDLLIRVNPEFTKIFGYAEEEALGRRINELIVPDDLRAEAEEYSRRVTHNGETLNVETARRHKDGTRVPVSIVSVPLPSKSDRIARCVVYRDLTDRKHFEERWRAVFENSAIGVGLTDTKGHFIAANSAYQKMLGYSEEELRGLTLLELTHEEDREITWQPVNELIRGAKSEGQIEKRYRRKDGSLIWVRDSITLLPGSESMPRFVMALSEDITEQKRLEDLLRYERDRLRLLLDMTNSMVSKLELRHLFEALFTNLRRVMQCDQCALLLPDPESGQLRTTMLYLPEGRGSAYEGMIVPIKGSVSGKVFRTGKTLWIDNFENLYEDPDIYANPEGQGFFTRVMAEGLRSGCFVPLVGRDRVLGVLHVCKRPENAFTQDDVVFLEQVAHQVAIAVGNALDYGKATEDRDKETEQKLYLQEEIRTEHNFGEIVGESGALRDVLQQVSVVSPTDSSVLILGETGTGKELLARAIHDLSARRERAFVKLNCAAIPLGLLESELFGHEKGAFTGAIAQKVGRFELANKGTLFLDEVGDIPLELQAKLLRVLQEQEFERLGSNRTHKVDVRIIAATHRDLAKMVEQQAFRGDLYYRLKVFPILVPALRDRREDIPQLVLHFVSRCVRRMKKTIDTIPAEVMEALVRYSWPGNIRELQNFVERAVILSPGSALCAPLAELEPLGFVQPTKPATHSLAQAEREHILRALEESNWVVGGRNGAAAKLGLKRTSLLYKMQKLGIRRAPEVRA